MGHVNGKITAPVGIDSDIAPVLGIGSYDLGYLCSNAHGKINKWAKIKPVTVNSMSVEIKTDKIQVTNPFTLSSQSVPGYWGSVGNETVNINFSDGSKRPVSVYMVSGLGIPVLSPATSETTDLPRIIDAMATNPQVNWPYKPVSNGIYRALDFDGYDHEALCPISYYVKERIYKGQKAEFGCYYRSESADQIDIQEFGNFFDNFSTYVLVVSPSGSRVDTLEFGLMLQGVDEWVMSSKSYGEQGTYKAYFVAADNSREKVLLLPSLQDYPNPMTFNVYGVLDPTDPNTNPFGFLYWDLYAKTSGFAYDNMRTYFESFANANEGDYTVLYTNSSYCFKIEFTNSSERTVNIELAKMEIRWFAYSFGNNNYAKLSYELYVDGARFGNTSLSFAPGAKKMLMFRMPDIYYDQMTGNRYYPQEGEELGNIDQCWLAYNGASVQEFDMCVVYPDRNNGYFYNTVNGFYISK